MNTRSSPLAGIRVLDLTRVLAGPWCTQTLGDLGADVIKIERPETGDDTRLWGPPYLRDENGNETSEAAYYLSTNRNKRSVVLDIATPEGAKAVRELAAVCDVLVENFKVGGLRRYGLDFNSLREVNPRLIYCSITGFGQNGPYANRPGYDFMIQGMGGLMSITGERDDLPGGGPQKAGVAVSDLFTGMYASVAILAALQERSTSGLGQHIDLALLDCHVAMLANQNLNYMTSGVVPQRAGNAHQNVVPYQVFAASDGHLIVAVGNETQYQAFCKAINRPDLAVHENYCSNRLRVVHREALIAELSAVLAAGKRDDWLTKLEAAGVPCGPINTIAQAFDHPQVKARKLWRELPHPLAGSAPTAANPIRFSETPIQYTKAPPTLGQHTRDVLREYLGWSDERIEALQNNRSSTVQNSKPQ